MKTKKTYLPPEAQAVAVEFESSCCDVLIDSGKKAMRIAPIEVVVDPFDDLTFDQDLDEISFM